MIVTYTYKYRRYLGNNKYGKWVVINNVMGHMVSAETDSLDLRFSDGGIQTVRKFSELEIRLGTDWVHAIKDQMERESGQDIKLNLDNCGPAK